MADNKKQDDADYGKKCLQTGVSLKRAKRYYRNGKYFLNKNAFKAYQEKMLEEANKEAQPQQT